MSQDDTPDLATPQAGKVAPEAVAREERGVDTLAEFFGKEVGERLAAAKESLPPGLAEPQMGPIATGLGEIYLWTLDAAPDAIAVETIPDIDEARALAIALADVGDELPDTWVAFSASANPTIGRAGVATAAGDDLGDAAAVFADLDRVVAIGVNCTAPSHVAPALERIAERTDRPLVAYPNGGGRWDPATGCWDQAGERITADMVASWLASGVRLLGGCCGFGPDALADLADLAGVQRRTR